MIKEYILPEFAFLDAHSHLGDELKDRIVVLHTRSATVLEFFQGGEINLSNEAITHEFTYLNSYGIKEEHILVLHYSAILKSDIASLLEFVFLPAVEWYKKYLNWEDNNITSADKAELN